MGRKGIIAAICALLTILLCVWLALGRRPAAVSERQLATRILAEHLKTSLKPRAVIAFSNPLTQLPDRPAQTYEYQKAGLAGLIEGFGQEVPVKAVFPKLKPEVLADPSTVQVDPRTTTPLSFLVTENSFDELFEANKDCDLAVSLIGLPVNLRAVRAWTQPGPPRFALLLPDWRIIGDIGAIREAFASGKLVAAIIAKPNALEALDRRVVDSAKWFEERYFLVTSNNVETALKQFPRVFTP